MRVICMAVASFLLLGTTAMGACPGQVGKVIFDDNFADDSGGWELSPPHSEIKDGALLIRPNAGGAAEKNGNLLYRLRNLTFPVGEGDFCVEFVFPTVPEAKYVETGLVFWQSENGYYVWHANTNKNLYLSSLVGGKWNYIFTEKGHAGVKLEPDAVNSLRVVAKGGKLTLFLNGSQIKVIRALMPAGQLHFGLFTEAGEASAANPTVQVKSFKVTAGP